MTQPPTSTPSITFIINLESKSEIQTFVSFILSIFQIVQFLLLRQRIPFPVSRLVAPDVIQFYTSSIFVIVEQSSSFTRSSRHISGGPMESAISKPSVKPLRRQCPAQNLATCWELF